MTTYDDPTDPSLPPRVGTLLGGAQAAVAALLMLMGSSSLLGFDDSPVPVRTAAFGPVLLGLVFVLVGLGLVIDFRRRTSPLELVMPIPARSIGLFVGFFVPLVPAAIGGAPIGAYLCLGCVASPYVMLALDRVAGPAWVLVRLSRRAWDRRRWSRHMVIDVEEGLAIIEDERGERSSVRTDSALGRGFAHLDLEPIGSPAEPYRSTEVRAIVRRSERPDERARRRNDIATAALGLVSGLAWIALPFSYSLGHALTDWTWPPEWAPG